MKIDDTIKVIYEDKGQHKVIKGTLKDYDEFTYTIKASYSQDLITIGKRAIVKISAIEVNE